MPITAKEALAISKGVQEVKEKTWTKSELRSLKRAYREIRRESKKGRTFMCSSSYKPKVYKELEKQGFTVDYRDTSSTVRWDE